MKPPSFADKDRVELEGEAEIPIRAGQDFLVIATGSSTPAPARPVAFDSAAILKEYSESSAAISAAGKIVIVGGGPVGVELAGEIKDRHPDKDVTIVHRGAFLCSSKDGGSGSVRIPEAFGAKLREICEDRGITVRVGVAAEVGAGSPPSGLVSGVGTMRLSDGSTIPGVDLAVWVTGAKPNSEAFRATLKEHVNKDGRLKVDPSLLLPGTANVFAVGDCAETGVSKTMYMAVPQVALVGANVRALAGGASPDSLKKLSVGMPAMFVPIGAARGRGMLPICGGMQVGDGMVSSAKGKDLFTAKVRADAGLAE